MYETDKINGGIIIMCSNGKVNNVFTDIEEKYLYFKYYNNYLRFSKESKKIKVVTNINEKDLFPVYSEWVYNTSINTNPISSPIIYIPEKKEFGLIINRVPKDNNIDFKVKLISSYFGVDNIVTLTKDIFGKIEILFTKKELLIHDRLASKKAKESDEDNEEILGDNIIDTVTDVYVASRILEESENYSKEPENSQFTEVAEYPAVNSDDCESNTTKYDYSSSCDCDSTYSCNDNSSYSCNDYCDCDNSCDCCCGD